MIAVNLFIHNKANILNNVEKRRHERKKIEVNNINSFWLAICNICIYLLFNKGAGSLTDCKKGKMERNIEDSVMPFNNTNTDIK